MECKRRIPRPRKKASCRSLQYFFRAEPAAEARQRQDPGQIIITGHSCKVSNTFLADQYSDLILTVKCNG